MKFKKDFQNICVVGTDTNVGKTVLSLMLMNFFYQRGFTPFYIKPFQTGTWAPDFIDSDSHFIYQYLPQLTGKNPQESMLHCFTEPLAPYFAAKKDERLAEINNGADFIAEKTKEYSPLIIEAAGGVMVPLTEDQLFIDMMDWRQMTPIIASRPNLGTINHTLLTIEALKSRGVTPLGVVFIHSAQGSVTPERVAENRMAIETHSGVPVLGEIPYLLDFTTLSKGHCTIFDIII